MKISAVATTYNNEDEIVTFLDNILSQTRLPDELIISDGGSKDNTVNIIKSYMGNNSIGVDLSVRSGKRLNIAEGYNDAIKSTKYDLILVCGVGNKYPDDFIERLEQVKENRHADVMCPYIHAITDNKFMKLYGNVYLHGDEGQNGVNAANHGCLANKVVFYDVGFFYEKFIYAGEDAEFYAMANKKGFKVESDPSIYVFWDVPHSWKELLKQEKNYAIATMQIKTEREILKIEEISLMKMTIAALGIVLTAVPFTRIIGLFILLVLAIRVCIFSFKYSFWGGVMLWVHRYSKFYYYIRYRKFFKPEYKVNR